MKTAIATPLFELQSKPAHSQAPTKGGCHVTVKIGSIEIPIYKGNDGRFTIAWYEGTTRKRTRRATLDDAKSLAKLKATAMANGQQYMASMTEAHRATLARVIEILAPIGKTPELAAAEYAEAIKRLPAGFTLLEAVQCANQYRPAEIKTALVPAVVEEMLESKRKDGIGKRWASSLENQLKRFKEHFKCPMHALTTTELDDWLRSLKGGLRNRANHRAAVLQLVNFAKLRHYLPRTWAQMDPIKSVRIKDSEIKILTPEQMVSLLFAAQDNLIPFIAITAFAGIRHQEMCGEKALLDWSHLDFDAKLIYVPRGVGKTGDDRIVPMQPNLLEWLKPHIRRNGPICSLVNASKPLLQAKKRAGIPCGKNETRNTLRKSFISYRLAIIKDAARVADEAGNSVAKIKSNYKRVVPETEAKRWFEIRPTDAGILQLKFALP